MGAVTPLYKPETRSSFTIVDSAWAVEEYLDARTGSWNRTLTEGNSYKFEQITN